MANIFVASYYSRWDMSNHQGRIAMYDSNSQLIENRIFKDPSEFQVVISMLRNEKPLWFNTEVHHLKTGSEPVGEAED